MSSNTAQPQSLSQRYYDALLLGDRAFDQSAAIHAVA
jgi:hypothetical protein